MSRLLQPRLGRLIKNAPAGFPLYTSRRPRIIAGDIWEFLRHECGSKLPAEKTKMAFSFIEQAYDFYEATKNPRIGSKSLLYYYSFLNLVKAFLLVKKIKIPNVLRHGISDPKANVRLKLTLSTQVVSCDGCAQDHSKLFPEFLKVLNTNVQHRTHKLKELLQQVPGIHRSYCEITRSRPSFLPIKSIDVLKTKQSQIFIRLKFSSNDKDVDATLPIVRKRRAFKTLFTQVSAQRRRNGRIIPIMNEKWYQSKLYDGKKRKVNTGYQDISKAMCKIGLWNILTRDGQRFYFSSISPANIMPSLGSIYAIMFYLGSITRYKPYDFDKIFKGKYAWLVAEFFKTQPMQFIYGLAGQMANVEVAPTLVISE